LLRMNQGRLLHSHSKGASEAGTLHPMLVIFLSLWQNMWEKQLAGWRIIWLTVLKVSVDGQLAPLLWSWGKEVRVVKETAHLLVASKQREEKRSLGTRYILKRYGSSAQFL
jgi:hypothetical protein